MTNNQSNEIEQIIQDMLINYTDWIGGLPVAWDVKKAEAISKIQDRERLYIPKSTIKNLIEAAKILNLELHGREDCKNCALMEQLEEML